ncbi:hypothetical protein ACFFUB_13075 [Algimonas porphyrae]|uniref:DUF541 domain-containing protein n=1 Tax=Algimonas porphyrae TaxID=1128113 RepID=A0ABQ5UVQ5_9PROT|nr:hypothetical protein [Algimonas porphyrae]GLQ19350.1 hypothetical protein GCM10007854_03050 [Algimonas porphyrae]
MANLLRAFIATTLFSLIPVGSAYAQTDEIVVTGSRISIQDTLPGQVLIVRGDNLLLEVRIESDARNLSERLAEIDKTIRTFTAAADRDAAITLSYVDGNAVRPLSPSLYKDAISRGSRPDTSVARIQLKTAIPDTVADSFALATQLTRFVDKIPETGRITIENTDEIVISVVNPGQYRPAVIRKVTDEIADIRDQLGADYRVILQNIDRPIRQYRAGDLTLGFYIPYSYVVIPTSLDNLDINLSDDF